MFLHQIKYTALITGGIPTINLPFVQFMLPAYYWH